MHNAAKMQHLREFKMKRWTRGNSKPLRNNVNERLLKRVESHSVSVRVCILTG